MMIKAKSMSASGGIYYFSKDISISGNAEMKIKIFAETRYILYVNGCFAGEGPCRGAKDIRYFDEISCTEFLNEGQNSIVVKVLHMQEDGKFTSVFKSPNPSLAFEAEIKENGKISFLKADRTWKCEFDESLRLIYDNLYFKTTPPNEELLSEIKLTSVEIEEYDFNFDVEATYNYGLVGDYELKQRPIPPIACMEDTEFKIIKQGKNFIELDAGKYVTAKVGFLLKGKIGDCARIIYSECYMFGDKKKDRIDSEGELYGKSDLVHFSGEEQLFEPYWFRVFRFIRIETEEEFSTIDSHYNICHYPLDIKGKFECSNETYNKMWEISRNTLLCCMHEIFVDCPYREQQQYIMDSGIEMMVSLRLSSDTRLIEKMISEFASSQRPSGVLCCNYPCDGVQIIPAFSLYWIIMLADYAETMGKLDFAKKYIGVCDRIINYFEENLNNDGLYVNGKYWDYVDAVRPWGNFSTPVNEVGGVVTANSLLLAYALKRLYILCCEVERNGLVEEYKEKYERIKNAVNNKCFDKSKMLYVDSPGLESYSEHTAIWAALAETQPLEVLRQMLIESEKEHIHKCTFSVRYFMFRALEKTGLYDRAPHHLKAWKEMIELNCTTWCENPDNPSSECHAWSSAPLYELSANVLGVKTENGNEIIISPKCFDLSFARGTVPINDNLVNVDWNILNGKFSLKIVCDKEIIARIELPDGGVHTAQGKSFEFTCIMNEN